MLSLYIHSYFPLFFELIFFTSIKSNIDFVAKEDWKWAINEATNKKKQDFSKVEFLTYDEGLCVQCMHMAYKIHYILFYNQKPFYTFLPIHLSQYKYESLDYLQMEFMKRC